MRQGQKRCAIASTTTTRAAAATIIDCEGAKLGAALVLVGAIELEGPDAAKKITIKGLEGRYEVYQAYTQLLQALPSLKNRIFINMA